MNLSILYELIKARQGTAMGAWGSSAPLPRDRCGPD